MLNFTDFTFEYDQLFPQWDFSTDYKELLQFSEKYGTVGYGFGVKLSKKMFDPENSDKSQCSHVDAASNQGIYSLRKDMERKTLPALSEPSLKVRQTGNCLILNSKRMKYSARKDIVLKAVLRAIRRFYLNFFKARYPSLFLWRIVNVPQAQLTKSVKEMCIELFSAEIVEKYKLNIFVQALLDLKPVVKEDESNDVSNKASLAMKCCKSFSTSTFNKISKDPCFKKICQKIRMDFEEEFLETLKNQEVNFERYRKVLYSLSE
ncbi:unnamed protein product [Moneuplotes crassus]|uniref:Uncharacterized protein n=1 Tax=Euplotes crassus TaxID=5936 RepID=A0AAD1UJL8_EUPCR|nr:unnamed protein product [Moneuplotes crassus]